MKDNSKNIIKPSTKELETEPTEYTSAQSEYRPDVLFEIGISFPKKKKLEEPKKQIEQAKPDNPL